MAYAAYARAMNTASRDARDGGFLVDSSSLVGGCSQLLPSQMMEKIITKDSDRSVESSAPKRAY